MSDGAEYVKYVTERLIQYWEDPKMRELKLERKKRREPWPDRWFGHMVSAGFRIWLGEVRKNSARLRRREAQAGAGSGMPDYS